jgi:prolipoprotein diacylglyceryltransferase
MKIPKQLYKFIVKSFIEFNMIAIGLVVLMWLVSKYITERPFKEHLVLPIFLLFNVIPIVVGGRLFYGFLKIKTPTSPEEIARHEQIMLSFEEELKKEK